jgi:polyisoprenoid-binding protein YceI
VAKFPEARFDISGSEVSNGGSIKLKGTITIKGISKPMEFVSSMESADGSLVFKGHIEIDRTLFDVRYGSKKFFDNIADSAIDDIFTLDYELFLSKE